jgi:hypothetical protein
MFSPRETCPNGRRVDILSSFNSWIIPLVNIASTSEQGSDKYMPHTPNIYEKNTARLCSPVHTFYEKKLRH